MKNFKILTIANRKGGAGKSTCAAHIACEFVKRGYKIILIDLDPQKTLENWWKKREDDNPFLADVDASTLKEKISQIKKKGFDLCIIDTPGDTSVSAQLGIEVADLVLIPSKATSVDLGSIGRTIAMVKDAGKQYVFLLTQTVARSSLALKAVSILSGFGPVAPSTLANRIAYGGAMGEGVSAADSNPSAEKELRPIGEFLEEKLFNENGEKGYGKKEKI